MRLTRGIQALYTTKINPEAVILRVHPKKGEAGLKSDSDIIVDQVGAIDNRRLKEIMGEARIKTSACR